MKKNCVVIVMLCLSSCIIGFANESEALTHLAELEGKNYVKERQRLVSTDSQWVNVSDVKLKLLSRILKERRSNSGLFRTFEEIIQRSRVLRGKMSDKERTNLISYRGQQLAVDLSRHRTKNITALNMAMVELLWKTADDDYERLSAVNVLSLNSRPIAGVFKITHDMLQKAENNVLSYELLVVLFLDVVSYRKGDKQILIKDIMLVSKRFAKELYIQEKCLKFLKRVDPKDTQVLSGVISERIKSIKKEQREKAKRNKSVEEVNITITGP